MVKKLHKTFEVIGQRVSIIDPTNRDREGILQESKEYQTTAEGVLRPALDFIEPRYNPNPELEEIARGLNPRERVDPRNPILSLHFGIDHLKLDYNGKEGINHIFKGELVYMKGGFINDGNQEIYEIYREALRSAGFDVR